MEIIVFIIGIFCATAAAQTNYCNLCNGQQTVCLRKNCAITGPCLAYRQVPLSTAEKNNILARHNIFRNQVAIGDIPNQPPAANMLQLIWDDELADIAQCWAFACTYAHDTCRDVPRFQVGQNAGKLISSNTDYIYASGAFNSTIQSWFDEYRNFNASRYLGYTIHNPTTGRYTQAVWAATRYIGCGRVYYPIGKYSATNLFCNYGQAGNYITQAVYLRGLPASKCPVGTTKSTTYAGLCN